MTALELEFHMTENIENLFRGLLREMGRSQRAFAERAGLNVTDLLAVFFVHSEGGEATPSALARHLGMTTGATAILLNRLEARNMIERHQHPSDRRATLLSLGKTMDDPKIQSTIREAFDLERVVPNYTAAELATVERFLSEAQQALKDRRETLLGK